MLGAGDELSEGTTETRTHARLMRIVAVAMWPRCPLVSSVDRCGGEPGHGEDIEVSQAAQGPICPANRISGVFVSAKKKTRPDPHFEWEVTQILFPLVTGT